MTNKMQPRLKVVLCISYVRSLLEVMIIDRLNILCVNKIFLQNSSTHTKSCSNWLLYYNDGAPQKLVIAYDFWLTKK